MNTTLLFLRILPLLLYIAVDYFKGFKAGIYAAMISTVVMLGYDYVTTGALDQLALGESFLIVAMGVLSLKLQNDRYFKFQPAAVDVVIALVFLYFEVRHKPLLVQYLPQIEALLDKNSTDPNIKALISQLHSEQMRLVLQKLGRIYIVVFGVHAAIMAYAANHLSTPKWGLLRFAIYPALFISVMIAGITSAL